MPDTRKLSDVIPGYPEDHPQSLRELIDASPESITHELAWFLRKEGVEVRRSSERHYINGPEDAFTLLKNKYVLHPLTGRWSSYALSETRQVITVPHQSGGSVPLRAHTPIIPKAKDLPPLPRAHGKSTKQPGWLIIHGGTPDVLSKPGVARGLAHLQETVSVRDILFYSYDKNAGVPPTMWSVRAGKGLQDTGASDGNLVEFPDLDALAEVKERMKA